MTRYSCFQRLTSLVCVGMILLLGAGNAAAGDIFAVLDPAQATPFSLEDCERLAEADVADAAELGDLNCGRPDEHFRGDPDMHHDGPDIHHDGPKRRHRTHPPAIVPHPDTLMDLETLFYVSFVAIPLLILALLDPDSFE
jgi:hypothetical protein